ncbi:MAG: S-methyl-5-thioribose-1-phosphate isomerase [Planctomycetaceae bacterium]|nr:S-methyl-5-thioribose-1-phosphate isomerase [Planctomycetaceae bacterium]
MTDQPHKTLEWIGESRTGHLRLLDQTKLPSETVFLDCDTLDAVWGAIKRLSVRGAPAIGVSAAYGVIVGMQSSADLSREQFDANLEEVAQYLATSRPTAVNLFWALDRMTAFAASRSDLSAADILTELLEEARRIDREDQEMCLAIGQHGAALLPDDCGVLTHCNAGGLATAGDGTALSVFFAAHRQGKKLHVYADETRPLLQGSRLTAWELQQRQIPVTVICDSVAGWVMKQGRIQAVVTGADRIAANGDAANKIGTYAVAQLAHAHGIPFYIAAPSSTFDLSLSSGEEIPIEERDREEVVNAYGLATAPEGVDVFNPAFDVTPAKLITAIITERGVIDEISRDHVAAHLQAVPS